MGDIALNAYVNFDDFIMFDTRVDPSIRSDVLLSTLYTQLAAANKVSKMTDYPTWQQTYLGAMTTFGWRLHNNGSYSHALDCSMPPTLWALITDVLEQAGAIKLPAAARDLAVLATLLLASTQQRISSSRPHDESVSFFRERFQVSFVSAEHTLHSVLLSFNTVEPLGVDPLLQSLDPGLIVGTLDVMFFSARLLDIHYEMYRDAFESALAEKKKTFTLPIGGEQ